MLRLVLRATLALILMLGFASTQTAYAVSPVGDVVGKVTVGYQGWFATPSDGTPIGVWWHWASNEGATPSNTNSVIHAWPDMREFTNQYPTAYSNFGDGETARLFSSDDQQVVTTQFQWMAQNGIDCAALQRFNPTGGEGPERNQVTQKVIAAAAATGVKFYIMYDTSGWGSTFDTDMENDWTNVINSGSINVTASPQYAHQNGKPVVCIWGMGFNDGNHPTNVTQCINLINWFKSKGVYVIGGTPTHWLAGNSDSVSGFISVYHDFNMISPWMVGRIGTAADSDNFKTSVNAPDIADCNANGIDYQPCVLPGDTGQRLHGTFMWEQFYNMISAGSAGVYISMFDEFNEGNQICKTAEDSAMSPVGGVFNTSTPFFTLDQDGTHCSSDFYLRETNDGDRMLKGQIALTKTMPTLPVLTPAAPTNLKAAGGTGQITLTWTASDETSSYVVLRSTSAGGEAPVATGITGPPSGTFPRPTITYTNGGLVNGTNYFYEVEAVNPTGTSGPSNQISATTGGATEGPFNGTPAGIPGTVQAENYDTGGQGVAYNATSTNGTDNGYRSDGIDLEVTSDTGGGVDLGWTSAGQWFKYTVNVATAGTYSVAFRVANGSNGNAQFHLQNSSGTNLSGTVTVAPTGGWQTWTTVSASVTLPAGQQILTLWQDTGGFNVNYASFATSGSAPPTPTGLTATAGNGSVALAWSVSTGATGYDIYRSTTSGAEGTTPVATSNTNSFNDGGLTNGTTYFYKVAAFNSFGTSGQSGEAQATPSGGGGSTNVISIACGNGAVGVFVADTDFSGGAASTGTTSSINTSKVTNPAPVSVYQHARKSTCTYTIGSLAAGTTYNLRLDFCEYVHTAAGQREFNVSINGNQVLTNYDIFANAGGEFIANTQSFTATANSSGQIVIVFTTVIDNSLVGGIEISTTGTVTIPPPPTALAATAGNGQNTLSWNASSGATSYNVYRGTTSGGEGTTPIATGISSTSYVNSGTTNGTTYYYRVAAVNSAGTSGMSNEASATPVGTLTPVAQIDAGSPSAVSPFSADTDFNTGNEFSSTATINTAGVANAAPAAVYQTVRWNSSFAYTIPNLTPNASYTVRLHFCELTFTAAAQRQFNVAINGASVLSNFDIFATAGAQNKAVTQQFTTTSNGSGQVVISFTQGAHDNPEVAGIEILH